MGCRGKGPNSEGVGPPQTGKTQCLGLVCMKHFVITLALWESVSFVRGTASEDSLGWGLGAGDWG